MAPYHIRIYRQHSYIIAREAVSDLLNPLVFITALIYFHFCFQQILSIMRNHNFKEVMI